MTLFVLLVLIIILFTLLYKWLTAKYNILNERKVPHNKPKFFFGNFDTDILIGNGSLAKLLIELQLKYRKRWIPLMQISPNKVYGMYRLREPVVFVQDPDLIRKVLVNDFDSFTNRGVHFKELGPEFSKSLYNLKDSEWKEMRNILAPPFTGNNIRIIFELINECCLEGVNYLNRNERENYNKEMELSMDDTFLRFTNDITASAALGIKVVSFHQKENSFFKVGSKLLNYSNLYILKFNLVEMMPRLMKTLGVTLFNAEKLKHFNNLVLSAIKYREQHNIVRPDIIHQLIEAKKHKNSILTPNEKSLQLNDQDIIAHCLLIFCSGFGKTGTGLRFTAHELIKNPDVQDKLYREILEVQAKLNGKALNYGALLNMKYMDMVVLESLRKWPPELLIERICNEDYDLLDNDGNTVIKIKKNNTISISIIGLHRDPEYFENPEKFEPERFAAGNRRNIKPFTYLPFGEGPRMCIGSRLALIQMKLILYHLLLRYEFLMSPKTEANSAFTMPGYPFTADCYWFKLSPRN